MHATTWQIDDFYSHVSANIAERCASMDLNQLPRVRTFISVQGIKGKSPLRVTDFTLTFEKQRFFELIPGLPETTNLANNLWSDLQTEDRRQLEARVTYFLRLKNKTYDCVLAVASATTLLFSFRVSSLAPTQTPVSFKPLYHRLFHLVQEVQQGEFAITHAGSVKPILATWHLAECVAFAAFNQTHKLAILAHIDPCANIPQFFSQLKTLLNPLSKTSLVFEYVLLGGASLCAFENHTENIIEAAKKASKQQLKFELQEVIGSKISKFAFELDSWWCPSMRLSRSIAIDATAEDPLRKCGSYEPDINPESHLHKRQFTLEEADRFEIQRAKEHVLAATLCLLPSNAS